MNRKILLLITLSAIVYFSNIWGTSVYVLDEAKNASCAMEMYQRGNWIVPTFNGQLRTDKPPLHYFFMGMAYSALKVSPFSARFFSSLMGVLTILSVFLFARKIVGEKVAYSSSLILLCSIQLSVQFHLAVPDPYLIFFLTSGWLSFFYGWTQDKKFLYVFYISISLATLTKGPVAVLFSGLIVFIFLIVQRSFTLKSLEKLKIVHGLIIFTVIGLPWYLLVGAETDGEWLKIFFVKHNLGRFTSTMEGHEGFPLASFVIALVGLMPFSFFIPQAALYFWRQNRSDSFLQFCIVSASVVLVFFLFSKTILPSYPEPAFPFIAIFLGFYFARGEASNNTLWISAFIYLLITGALPAVSSKVLKQDQELIELSFISSWFYILPAGALAGLIFLVKREIHYAFYAYASSNIAFIMIAFYFIMPAVDIKNPVMKSKELFSSETPVYYYRDVNPGYVFLLQMEIPKLENEEAVRRLIETTTKFQLITQKRYLHELERFNLQRVFEGKDIFEKQTTVILEK